ncbi:hypothetical protein B4073_1018 [Bacillus subtilis]|nr:hypothetical protein B4069_0989 [Bacillus subtilis]KIN32261.1 hypothetical protein B4068_0974 [Bacillus subtilis]KIN44794.1 hypothetical protein B4072_1001 [Bacillus subtilis]KIN53886.1 hypothetical protein B4073_1018 [Bacillus subtilis]
MKHLQVYAFFFLSPIHFPPSSNKPFYFSRSIDTEKGILFEWKHKVLYSEKEGIS